MADRCPSVTSRSWCCGPPMPGGRGNTCLTSDSQGPHTSLKTKKTNHTLLNQIGHSAKISVNVF